MFSMRVAVANQFACATIMQADEQFKKSCDMCCNSPQCLYRSCNGCRVAEMHRYIVEQLKSEIKADEEVVA